MKAGTANADRRGMSRWGDRVKKNNREHWPSMLALLGAGLAAWLLGPFVGLIAALAGLGLYEYRRRQVQD
jgi:hypothetical protein